MKKEVTKISLHAARLIIGFLHNKLTKLQKAELDEWITESSDNMDVFDELTSGVDDNIFDPEKLIVDTDEAIELWIVCGLIVRHHRDMNNMMEKKYLQDWINSSEQNAALFNQLQQPAIMQKVLVWNFLRRQENETVKTLQFSFSDANRDSIIKN